MENFSRGLGCIREVPTGNEPVYENHPMFLAAAAQLPVSVDLRPKLMPIRDQGQSSECVAFASSAMKELQESISLGLKNYFSPQFIYDNRPNKPEQGMQASDAMSILQNSGCCLEDSFKFTGSDVEMPSAGSLTEAGNYKISSFAVVTTLDGIKAVLSGSSLAVISLPVYNYGGTFWKAASASETLIGGHCVAIAGYDDSASHLILRNSWGTSWGSSGYTNFPYADFAASWGVYSSVDGPSVKPNPMPTPDTVCRCEIL